MKAFQPCKRFVEFRKHGAKRCLISCAVRLVDSDTEFCLDLQHPAQRAERPEQIAPLRQRLQCFQLFGASAELCPFAGQNSFVHHAHKRIIIQQEFIQIPNVVVKAVARSGQIQLHEIVEGCTEALRKMRPDRFVIGFALRKLRSIEQRRQERKRGAFPAVVTPHGQKYVLHAVFPAACKRCFCDLHAVAVVRGIACPLPQAAREPCAGLQLLMCLDHAVIVRFIRRIIIPVDKLHVCRDLFTHRFVDLSVLGIILSAGRQLKEHIRPDQEAEAICFADFAYALQMRKQRL